MRAGPCVCCLIGCILPLPLTAAIIHVPGDQPTIQLGIDAVVDGDTVLVADGTYTSDGNRDIDFLGKAITVRSENGAENCIIDCEGSESDPHRGFYFHYGEGLESVLTGFTIRNGNQNGDDDPFNYCGGGVYCEDSSPTITNNTIVDNSAGYGGGIYCSSGSSPTITNNTITSNFVYGWWEEYGGDSKRGGRGGGIYCEDGSPTIINNTIIDNIAEFYYEWPEPPAGSGGGIYCRDASPTIKSNTITGNSTKGSGGGICCKDSGGGIYCEDGSTTIANNIITANPGGGISCDYVTLIIKDCTITGNSAGNQHNDGGGIWCKDSTLTIEDCTITGNSHNSFGGGIQSQYSTLTITGCVISDNKTSSGGGINSLHSTLTITGCVISDNEAFSGGGINSYIGSLTVINSIFSDNYRMGIQVHNVDLTIINSTICNIDGRSYYGISGNSESSDATVTNTIVWGHSLGIDWEGGGEPVVTYSDVQGGWPGEGNIDEDPLFVNGLHGDYYLSNVACGYPETSPCVDAGNPSIEVPGTTGCLAAWGSVDMGYHYPAESGLVVGSGPTPDSPPCVRIYPPEQDAEAAFEFDAYGPRHYGVNVSCGDVYANSVDEILTGPGPGEMYGPHVRGFQVDGEPLPGISYFAYGTHKYGVNVGAGDIDGDGFDEIITGAGPGAVFGPHVRGWDYDDTGEVTPIPGVSYFAYGTPKWGVNVSAGDIDGDGYDEIVTGAGPGAVYGPHVRGWNVDDGAATAIPAVSFLAYGTNKYGVNVTCGDVDGDGIDEIVTGPGPGEMFGAHVRGWNYDGASLASLPGFSFMAWNDSQYGANVFAGTDLNGDGRDELVVGCGSEPETGPPVKVYLYDGSEITLWFSLGESTSMTHGANVAAGCF